MKKLLTSLAAAAAILSLSSCEDFSGPPDSPAGSTTLRWSFSRSVPTRTLYDLPDTNDFILTVTNSSGSVLYNGPYGASPEVLPVAAGSYILKVVSTAASLPAFDTPVYGDEEVILIKEGENALVRFGCTLQNAGMKLRISRDFTDAYPEGFLYVSVADGKLLYGPSESRTAFFRPGTASLLLYESGEGRTVFSRDLFAGEILSLKVSPGSSSGGSSPGSSTSIQLDTAAIYMDDECIVGEVPSDAGSTMEKAMGIAEARASAGRKGVWVLGFIVGGDLSSSGSAMTTEPPFAKDTHFAIAARSSTTAKASCMSVELKKGEMRDALNLVSNPGLKGRAVYLKGDIVESYFGIPGIKNVTQYHLKE